MCKSVSYTLFAGFTSIVTYVGAYFWSVRSRMRSKQCTSEYNPVIPTAVGQPSVNNQHTRCLVLDQQRFILRSIHRHTPRLWRRDEHGRKCTNSCGARQPKEQQQSHGYGGCSNRSANYTLLRMLDSTIHCHFLDILPLGRGFCHDKYDVAEIRSSSMLQGSKVQFHQFCRADAEKQPNDLSWRSPITYDL